MSVIIRLQNLSWSANSVDIRSFFSGLSIPEGGVHIVGGERGDAFIAFGWVIVLPYEHGHSEDSDGSGGGGVASSFYFNAEPSR